MQLVREKAVVLESTDVEQAHQKVIDEAQARFRYHYTSSRLKQASRANTVSRKLHDLGIEPLKAAVVKAYQRRKLVWENLKDLAPGLGMILGFCILSVLAFVGAAKMHSDTWSVVLGVTGVALIFPVICSSVSVFHDRRYLIWQRSSLQDYQNEIPVFALERALTVDTGLQGSGICFTDLYVEFLGREAPKAKDPFLVLRSNGRDYYLDVWEEGQFERKV